MCVCVWVPVGMCRGPRSVSELSGDQMLFPLEVWAFKAEVWGGADWGQTGFLLSLPRLPSAEGIACWSLTPVLSGYIYALSIINLLHSSWHELLPVGHDCVNHRENSPPESVFMKKVTPNLNLILHPRCATGYSWLRILNTEKVSLCYCYQWYNIN